MAISHSPLCGAFGAEVHGIDLARIDDVEFVRLYEIWKRHHVVLLRRQELDDAQFGKFSALFGELEPPPADADGDEDWRADMSHLERPPFASVLWAPEVPRSGGGTWFASMTAALRSMPSELVTRIGRLVLQHHHPGQDLGTNHPVVIVQPETGESTLFLGRRRDAWFPGVPLDESERLLNILWSYATAPAVSFRHPWQAGDVVLWNNLTTMHKRDAASPDGPRAMHRSRIKGRYVLSAPIQQEAA